MVDTFSLTVCMEDNFMGVCVLPDASLFFAIVVEVFLIYYKRETFLLLDIRI